MFIRKTRAFCRYFRLICIPTFIVFFFFCRFLGSGDPNTFFSRAQRSRMVYEILATTPFGKEKKGEVGIERMVDEGAYSGAFPLHDVSKMKNSMIESQTIGQNWSKLTKT